MGTLSVKITPLRSQNNTLLSFPPVLSNLVNFTKGKVMCARSDWYLTMSQTFLGDQSDQLSLDHQTNSLSRTTNPSSRSKARWHRKSWLSDPGKFHLRVSLQDRARNEEIELIKSNFWASQTKMWWDKVWKLDFPAWGNFTILWVWKIGLKGGSFDKDFGIIKDI